MSLTALRFRFNHNFFTCRVSTHGRCLLKKFFFLAWLIKFQGAHHSLVTSIFLIVRDSWTLTAELQRRIRAMEMRCYCKILHISYKEHVTNEEVCAKIQQAIGPREDLTRRRRKETQTAVVRPCPLFIRSGQNHLARHNEWGKKTRQTEEEMGRQHSEWIGLEFIKSQRAVENREKWWKLAAKSCVVLQRPSHLRDR